VFLPLVSGDTTIGALAVPALRSNRSRLSEMIEPLHIVAETRSPALARQRSRGLARVGVEAQRMRSELSTSRASRPWASSRLALHQLNRPLTDPSSARREPAARQPARPAGDPTISKTCRQRSASHPVITPCASCCARGAETAHLDLNDLIRDVTKLVVSDALIRNVQPRWS
jgi:hypothetical protein